MRIGIVGNTQKPRALSVINSFVELLQARRIDIIFAEKLRSFLSLDAHQQTAPITEIGKNCDVLVAFGGDGTILATAKHVGATGVPILGVNIGTLGFLTEVTVDEMAQTIDDLLAEKYSIIERMVFKIEIERDYLTKTYFALNDVVLDKGLTSRLIFIDAKVDGRFLNSYRADGLIVATPTGSTAYSMSAGGPLLVPNMHAFIMTPICPHSITVRPIVLAADSVIELAIRKEAEPVQINIDGQNRYKLLFHEMVRISKADYNIRWISIGKGDFFHTLRTKLNWGANHKGVE
jgi:NAD+ kinase